MMATSSQGSSAVPARGSQEPTKLVVPDFATSDWKRCHDINAAGGIELLEWQDGILRGWLGKNALGRWAANTCGGSIARQNGKSLGLVVPRVNYGMLQLNEEVLYTSHLQKTSTETFESVAAFFDQPALRKHVKDIKTALGREQVILKRGGRVKFLARTRNGGRGQHGDLLIFDESLELSVDSQSSFLPAISASRNPQVIYVSSPPTATSDSDVFRDIRARALNGLSNRIAWFEWSVDAESAEEINVNDKALWYMTNPSLGILIQETTVEGEVEQMPHDTFARERLGWWSPTAGQMSHPIDAKLWESLVTDNPPQDGKTAYGVKFSIDGSEVCVCAALLHDGGAQVHGLRVRHRRQGRRAGAGGQARQDAGALRPRGEPERHVQRGIDARVVRQRRNAHVVRAAGRPARQRDYKYQKANRPRRRLGIRRCQSHTHRGGSPCRVGCEDIGWARWLTLSAGSPARGGWALPRSWRPPSWWTC